MTGKRIADFEIGEEIGKGGMGRVYKARQISLDRYVAIKVLPHELSGVEEFRERFDIEAKAVASLIHQNIIQMYSKGVTEDGLDYFAMEYVEGEDLSAKIKKGVKFSELEAIDIAIQACQGLEAAWKKNIIHRDIKPSNIILTNAGVVKIADFGLAKNLDATKKMTRTDIYMGTVAYTSPEQGEGKPVDHRTDIYSLGVVLYQLLTDRVPFDGETPSSVIYKHVYEPAPSPLKFNPGLSRQTEAVVLKAMEKKPEDRYQNVVEFREALESAKRGLSVKGMVVAGSVQQNIISPSRTSDGGREKAGSKSPVLILVVAIILLTAGALYAAYKYVYPAVFGKNTAGAEKTVKQNAMPSPPSGGVVTPPEEAGGSAATMPTPPGKDVTATGSSGKSRSLPAATVATERAPRAIQSERETASAGPVVTPGQSRPPKRAQKPTILIVANGESDAADIVRSVIETRFGESSFPLSSGDEIQSAVDRYGRDGIPLNALQHRRLKADVLVYATVKTAAAEPLRFYGRVMEQNAATITVKVIDAATGKIVSPSVTRTVRYTSLNMQDNIRKAMSELLSELPENIETFWKG